MLEIILIYKLVKYSIKLGVMAMQQATEAEAKIFIALSASENLSSENPTQNYERRN